MFQRDAHPIAHEVAVALLHHVADMNADAELNPPVFRQPGIALDEAVLHLDSRSAPRRRRS